MSPLSEIFCTTMCISFTYPQVSVLKPEGVRLELSFGPRYAEMKKEIKSAGGVQERGDGEASWP